MTSSLEAKQRSIKKAQTIARINLACNKKSWIDLADLAESYVFLHMCLPTPALTSYVAEICGFLFLFGGGLQAAT